MRHLFVLPDMRDLDRDDVIAIEETFFEMRRNGLGRLPYPQLTVHCIAFGETKDDLPIELSCELDEVPDFKSGNPDGWGATCRVMKLREGNGKWMDFSGAIKRDPIGWFTEMKELTTSYMTFVVRALVVFLATKNIVKETKRNKLAKFGVGKQQHEYVTTLKVGRIYVTENTGKDGEPSGRHYRAHFRRGHAREQRWGPGNIFTKKVWIDPIFVNSDREYVPRDRYNVSGMNHAGLQASNVDIRKSEEPPVLRPVPGARDGEDPHRYPPGGAPLQRAPDQRSPGADH